MLFKFFCFGLDKGFGILEIVMSVGLLVKDVVEVWFDVVFCVFVDLVIVFVFFEYLFVCDWIIEVIGRCCCDG